MPEPAMTYWAHSSTAQPPDTHSRVGWQPLAEHLEAVSCLARELAAFARPDDERFQALASVGGLLHDYGKYTDAFQRMLSGGRDCQHSIHGAMIAHFGPSEATTPSAMPHLAAAIAGHHAGLPDLTGERSSLQDRLNQPQFVREALSLLARARGDCAPLATALAAESFAIPPGCVNETPQFDLITRMLFSCLVDADRLDSGGRRPTQAPLLAPQRLETVLRHISEIAAQAPESRVKQMRARVLEDCLQAASSTARLFSLSVPTGGGKTLASMAFALRRAALQPEQIRRVIVVIPYLSIIEQNAQVYSKVFGQAAVLEHHSGSHVKLRVQAAPAQSQRDSAQELNDIYVPAQEIDDEDACQRSSQRTETENWDSPLIVTTSVRFFESLFSNRPRDLRRVHNIARSIVILDEVQTLPRRLLGPLLGMIRELAEDWGVNFVFSTATQPAFERPVAKRDLRWPPGTVTEIIQEPEPLRSALRRTEIHWEIEQPVNWSQVAWRALDADQCLAIVNLRRHAGELYAEMKRLAAERGLDPAGFFHLSTRMSAAHRLRVLDVIRERLRARAHCHVVSTQLVEAGVDIDFPFVLRALAPLDSVIQAAGRADREGLRSALYGCPSGDVVVFLPEDNRMPPNEYAEAAAVTLAIVKAELEEGRHIQVDSKDAMTQYFERYYGTSGIDLGADLVELRRGSQGKFSTLADKFEMISSRARDVFVPDDDEAKQAIAELRAIGQLTGELRRRLQRHTVALNPSEFESMRQVITELRPASEIWIAVEPAYDQHVGLRGEVEAGRFII
ncbi:MAG TPA: CRISPR-associated helicase Cas3' [Bryobacteraceae bacterium]|nr:CRISPR-associated helicase Cas3' [Bryobacteraceae bacterium]